jgi:PAT family beta-lactamase induction signal transducer AmpG
VGVLRVFRSRQMASIALLGFASGLPFYLTNRTMQAWLAQDGIDLSTIGFLSLVGLPYSLKFLWAPLLDRYSLPLLGRRKGWILATQFLLAASIAAMAWQEPRTALTALALNAAAIAFFSATQDVTVDAYRVDTLRRDETAAGASVGVLGYRVALIVTGSLAFILAESIGWAAVYLRLGGAMAVVAALTLLVTEPRAARPPETLADAVRDPFAEFVRRIGRWRALWVLSFVILYRLGDALLLNMTTPFLIQTGFSQSDIGYVQGGVGLVATLAGTVAAGAMAGSIGLGRTLWICGGLQALSNLAYLVLAMSGRNYSVMVGAIIVENLCGGLGVAALVGFLTTLCSPRFSATQYALLSSVVAAGRDLLASPAGALAEVTGWGAFFLLSCVLALPGLMLLPVFAPWNAEKPVSSITS